MIKRLVAAAIVAAMLTVTGCALTNDEPGEVTLVFTDNFSPKHPIGKNGIQPFIKYLQDNGPAVGLKIDYFGAGQLGKQRDTLTLMESGAVDMSLVIPAYLASELPLSGVGELPGLVDNSCAAVTALMPMVKPGGVLYESELKRYGVLPLWGISIPGYEIFTADRPVRVPNDAHGMMMRTPGGIGDRIVAGLGAAPVQIPGPDLYEAVARQTVSGAMLTRISVPSYSLEEVIRYSTVGANLSATTIYTSVRSESWNSLSSEQKQVINEASAMAQDSLCGALEVESQNVLETMAGENIRLHEVTDAERPRWDAALKPIRDGWVRDLESVGLPAGQALADLERRLPEVGQ